MHSIDTQDVGNNIDRNNSFTSSFRLMKILYQKNDIKLFNKGELILNNNSTKLMNNKILNSKWVIIGFISLMGVMMTITYVTLVL